MVQVLDPLLIIALALNLVALGVSRIRGVINAVALQGILLGVFPLFMHDEIGARGIALVLVTIALKGFVIPWFLVRAMREADIRHEVTPVIGFVSSVLLGAVGTGLAMAFSSTLPLAGAHADLLLVPASLSTVWTGLLMLITRRKAITQVVGYLVLENGIFLFGLLLLQAMPALVELGVLLDLFTGVFVMGIIIYHINRQFDSISTEHLTELKE
ncbi:MAG: hydrogenase [Planctomycetia bacterium]|nr:hydrogenase [Planctomycetia bacterium]